MDTHPTWREGYVADVSYDYSFFPELAPLNLVVNLLDQGIAAPSLEQFSYCELGCGQGFTTNVLAATHPQGQFWGVDLSPTHIAAAQQLARAAQLPNIQFLDQSFAEFLATETPKFDFITLHGVYSWIGDANRQRLVELLRCKLKCGGAVYISYNALPGWSTLMPLRELLVRSPQSSHHSTVQQVEQGLTFAQKLQALKARYFLENPLAQSELKEMKADSRNYLAHEYFNQDWHPLYHAEVAEQLQAAQLTFASSADLDDEFYDLKLTAEQQEFLAAIGDRTWRETSRDFLFNTRFRRDIFMRGAVRLAPLEQAEQLSQLRFVLLILPEEMEYEIELLGRPIRLDLAIYEPLVTLLAAAPRTLRELMQQPSLKSLDFVALWQALKILIATDYVAAVVLPQTETTADTAINQFNAALLKRSRFGSETQILASPITRSGIPISRSEQLFLLAHQRDREPIPFVMQILQAQSERLVKDDQPLSSPAEIQAELERQVEQFNSTRLPLFQRLGLV